MKSTGVIRRIDELGRIVIPKEIRKTLRIHDGDSLEIFTDNNDNIILSKFSSLGKISDYVINFSKTIHKFLKHDVIITDTDKIIAIDGNLKKKYFNKEISSELATYLKTRELTKIEEVTALKIINDEILKGYFLISPIIVESDTIGLLIIYSETEELMEIDSKIIQFVTSFFTKYLED
ncbi:MAG: AbrB/MazE/SpoVT family DNA-binding domain-containing protein [Bacilli bacterium]|nr:AbrB/MazE/SpoVT family DNA-binding domain-containing protein [Bacilli bacterium]